MNLEFYMYGKKDGKAQEYKVTAPIAELWAKYPQKRGAIIKKLREQAPFDNALIFSSKKNNIIGTVLAGISEF